MNTHRQYNKENRLQIIRNFLISSGFLLIYALFSKSANADSMDVCNEGANELNKSTPMQIDEITVLQNAVCIPTHGKPELRYLYKLDISTGTANQADINSLKPNQLNSLCTLDDTRALFEIVDVRYVYMDRTGKKIGHINMSVSECSG